MKFVELLLLCGLLLLNACTSRHFAPVVGKQTTVQKTTQQSQNIWHTVQLGENLNSIAQQYQQHYQTLARWNNIKSPYIIYPNQRLRIADFNQKLIPSPQQPALRKVQQKKTTPPSSSSQQTQSCQPSNNIWQWPTRTNTYKKTFTRTGRQGLKLFGYQGQAVFASESGVVIYSGNGVNGYQGGLIIIQHNPAYLSIYAQNQRRWVAKNTRVQRGQRIADMGLNSQRQAVLHFEISCYSKTVPPLPYFFQR